MVILTKPITLDILRNNIIKIETNWESDISSDYDMKESDYFWIKDGVLRRYITTSNDKPDFSKPGLFSRTKMGDREAVTYINKYIAKPNRRGYFDGPGFGMGTFSYSVSMQPNNFESKTEKSRNERVRSILGNALSKTARYASAYMDAISEEYDEKPKRKKTTSKSKTTTTTKKSSTKSNTTAKKKTASKPKAKSTAKKTPAKKKTTTGKKTSKSKSGGCR